MKGIVSSQRRISVHKEHEVLLKLELAGLGDREAQAIIESKDNILAKEIVSLIKKDLPQSESTVLNLSAITVPETNKEKLVILKPKHNDKVPINPMHILGKSTLIDSEVWICVHEHNYKFKLYGPAIVLENGEWNYNFKIVTANFHYDIRAYISIKGEQKIFDGKVLEEWPKAEYKSNLVQIEGNSH